MSNCRLEPLDKADPLDGPWLVHREGDAIRCADFPAACRLLGELVNDALSEALREETRRTAYGRKRAHGTR